MTVAHNRSRRGLWILVVAALVVLAIIAATLVYVTVWKKTDSAAIEPGSCPDLSAVPCVSDTPTVSVPLAGDQLRLVYAGDRLDGGVIQQATWHGWTLDQHHTYLPDRKLLLQGDGRTRSVAAVSRTSQGNQTLVVGAADGREVYEFDTRGRQLRTLDGMTGARLLSFGYDEQGRLASMTAGPDRKVTLDYATTALPRTITVNGSEVALSGTDRVTGVSDTDGAGWLFGYNDAGLLSDMTDPARGTTGYAYEGARLAKVTTPRDGSLTYDKKRDGAKSELTITADTGERTELSIDGGTREYRRTGQVSIAEQVRPDGGRHVQYGDGRVVEQTVAADPRLGASVPVLSRQQVTYPGKARTETTTDRKVELADNTDPLSLKAFHQSGSAGKLDYDAANRTLTSVTPAGRISTTRFDEQGRAVSRSRPGQQATEYHYDNAMLSSVSQGERTRSYSYDRKTGALSTKDPTGTSAVTVDSGGRVAQRSIGDGQPATFDYDPAGRLVGAAPPGRATHVFTWQGDGTAAGYAPPTDVGGRIDDVQTSTDTQGRVTGTSVGGESLYQVDHPGDGATSVKGKDFGLSITRDKTGLVSSAAVDRGERLEFGYDGDRLREQRLSGPVQGTVSTDYGPDGRLSEIQVGADGKVQLGHDPDGGLTKFGAAVFDRDKESGRVRSYTVGSVTVSVDYDQYGQVAKRSVGDGAAVSFRRDAAGRVLTATEHTKQGDRDTSFGYDAQRRLAGPNYDANGNPAEIGGRPATYDARDRLRTLGSAKLDYDRVGRLTSVDDAGVSTKYGWDPLGRLISAGKATYVVDAQGRRTGKLVDGKLVDGWLYLDALHPVAELDGSGKVVATFSYDDLGHLVGMTKQGKQYAIVTDQRNSPVFVVEADTGKLAQQLSYDAVGNVVADSNPGLQPFGLAGGLYDRDTKLVHFGARDYSPALGRWLSPDPKGFGAGDTNLYRYAMGDPVNLTDPTGLDTRTAGVCLSGALALGAGGSIGVCAQGFSDDPWDYHMYYFYGEEVGVDSGITATVNFGSTDDPGKGTDLFSGPSTDIGAGAWVVGGGMYKPLPGNKGFTGYYGGISAGEAGIHKGEYTYVAWGEPHLKTAKGSYDFMGVGEFVAATDGSDTFQIQVRQRPIPDSPVRASMITALAATVDGDKVGVYQERAEGDRLRVNGKPAAAGAGVTVLPHGGSVTRVGRVWTITWKDGTAIEAQDDGKALAVSLAPSAARAGKLKGLLGTAEGKLVKPDGKEIDTTNWPPSFDAVHKDFGPSWRLAADRSLFEYLPGESTDGFYDPNYATTPPDVSKLPAEVRGSAERLCEPLRAKDNNTYKACVLDVAVMGDPRFAASALRSSATRAAAVATTAPATPSTTTVNTGVLHDGDVRTGRINSAEQRDSYELDLGEATQFELQDVTGEVQAHIVGGDYTGRTLLPGPYEYAVSKPGRYKLEVAGSKQATGEYRFRFVTLKPRRFQVKVGDQIGQGGVPGTGRLDVPGRVDIYVVDSGGAFGISLAEGSRCDDQVTVGITGDLPDPHVYSPYPGCWYPKTSGEPEAPGRYVVMVWSNTAKTGDYSFRIESGR